MIYRGRSMRHGCRPHTGFIGKYPSGNADTQSIKTGAYHTAGHSTGRKSATENRSKCIGNLLIAKNQNTGTQKQVQTGSQRN